MKNIATRGGIKITALAALSIFLLTACLDPRRVSWSPDGTTAAIIAGDGLRIGDVDGKLGEPKPGVELVNWFADSKHLLVVEYEKIESWQKIREYESPEELKVAIDTAGKMLAQAKQAKGNWESFEKSVQALPHTREAVIYLRENKDKDMSASGWETWTKVKTTIDVGVHRVCSYSVSDKALIERKELYRTMREIKDIRVSPHGKAFLVVYKQEQNDDTPYTLAHVSIDSGTVSTVSSASATSPDWSRDGSEIYFIEAELPATLKAGIDFTHIPLMGSVYSQSINPDSELLKDPVEKKRLARLVFNRTHRVRAIANGGVLFSATPVQLPGSDAQIVRKHSLFAVYPKQSAMVVPVLPSDEPETGGDLIEFFEMNNAGTHVSIPGTKEGTVVYSVKNGTVTRADGGGFRWSKRFSFAPTWRTDDELCLEMVRPTDDEKVDKSEVVLYSVSKETARSLSDDWSAPVRKRFLEQ